MAAPVQSCLHQPVSGNYKLHHSHGMDRRVQGSWRLGPVGVIRTEPQGQILLLHRKERPLYSSLLRGHLTLGIYSKAGPSDPTYFKAVKEFLGPWMGFASNSASLWIEHYQHWEVVNGRDNKSVCKPGDLGGESVPVFNVTKKQGRFNCLPQGPGGLGHFSLLLPFRPIKGSSDNGIKN